MFFLPTALPCAFIFSNTVTTTLICFPHKVQREFIHLGAEADKWKVILSFLFPMPYPH